jgi:microcystin synthetase protein McyG
MFGAPTDGTSPWPRTLPEGLRRSAERAAGRGCFHVGARETHQSWTELLAEAEALGAGLLARGLAPGDLLLLELVESRSFLSALWGCLLAGVVAVPVPATIGDAASVELADRIHRAAGGAPRLTTNGGSAGGFLTVEELTAEGRLLSWREVDPDRTALLLATSGTTAAPRLVRLSHRNILTQLEGMAAARGLGPEDVVFDWLPLGRGAGLLWALRSTLLGCRHVQGETAEVLAEPLCWLEWVERYSVTRTWAPSSALRLLLDRTDAIRAGQWDLSSLRSLALSSERVAPALAAEVLALLAPHGLRRDVFHPAYGLSETAGNVTVSLAFDPTAALAPGHAIDLGPPIAGMAVRVVAEDGKAPTAGEEGEIEVTGAAVTAGYWGDPEATRAARTTDGWWRTGDRGRLVAGRLQVTGRSKDIVIVHGVNLSLLAIESAAEGVLGAAGWRVAACALGGPGDDGEAVGVFLERREGPATKLEDGAAIGAVRAELFRVFGVVPGVVGLLAAGELPLGRGGKVSRRELAARWLREAAAVLPRRAASGAAIARSGEESELAAIGRAVGRVLARGGAEPVAVAPDQPFAELGLGSLDRVQVAAALAEARPGIRLAPTALLAAATVRDLAAALRAEATEPSVVSPRPAARRSESARPAGDLPGAIAVVALACRLPGAADPETLWRNLRGGVESIELLDDEDLRLAGVPPPLARDHRYVRAAAVLGDVAGFDAERFGFSDAEARWLDPQHRLMIECADEVLWAAGHGRGPAGDERVGVFVGARESDYLAAGSRAGRDSPSAELQRRLGGGRDYLAPRLSHVFDLHGPSVNVATASSTSLVAVHLAVQSLLRGECDLALAGGVALRLPQRAGYLWREGLLFSPDGHTRSYDAAAAGTVFGNGAGLVALRRLSDALALGDPVLAVLRGSAINHDGRDKAGFGAPSTAGQVRLLRAALEAAALDARDIGYLEGHGTATALGDAIELAAASEVFAALSPGSCALGSIKSNIGHAGQAAGIAGLIKAVLILRHGEIPPSLHFECPNPWLVPGTSPFEVATTLRPWGARPCQSRRVGVTSLGLGGTNAHVILEEAPPSPGRPPGPPPAYRRRHFWLDDPVAAASAVPEAEPEPTLLGSRVASPLATVQFSSRIGLARFPWLADHRVGGRVVLPLAAVVELALAAARAGGASPRIEFEQIEIEQLELLRPVVVPETGELVLQTVVAPAISGSARLELWVSEAAAASWQLHARAALRLDADPSEWPPRSGDALDFEAARVRCRPVDLEPREADRASRGVALGPTFRAVHHLGQGSGEAYGEVESPPPPPAGPPTGPPTGRIALLDACLQVAALTGSPRDAGGAPWLPWRIERVAVWGVLPRRLRVHASTRRDSPSHLVDVRAAGVDGRLVLEIVGLDRRPVGGHAEGPDPGTLFRRVWRPVELPEVAAGTGTWLVLGAAGPLRDSLAHGLEERGARVVLDLESSPGPLAGVVSLADLAASSEDDPEPADPGPAVTARLLATIDLVRALDRSGRGGPLWRVTRGAQRVATPDGEALDRLGGRGLEQAPLWGLAGVAGREHPALRGGLVDLDPAGEPAPVEAAALARVVLGDGAEDQLARRRGGFWAPRLVSGPGPRRATPVPIRPVGTYALVGGLGALGIEVAGWLVSQGAASLLLVGRNPPGSRALERLEDWRRHGIEVVVVQADVSRYVDLERALDTAAHGMPPVVGVFHLAGVAEDGLLATRTRAHLERSLAAKVGGGWNLHRWSLGQALEHFVLFSSVSGLTGPPGLGAYAAANRFLDALAELRCGQGLPALSIAWGRWQGLGLAGKDASPGLDPERALAALGSVLALEGPTVVVWSVEGEALRRRFAPAPLPPLFSEIVPASGELPAGNELAAAPGPGDIAALVAEVVGAVLGRAVAETDGDRDLGLDSLALLDLRDRLEHRLAVPIPLAGLLASPSLTEITTAARAAVGADPGRSGSSPSGSETAVAPLVLIHGILGQAEPLRPLIEDLGTPSRALASPAMDGALDPPARVEDMAEHFLAALRRDHPRGPYRLGGHSFGGLVAWEMARRLTERGESVTLVVLLDTFAPAAPIEGEAPEVDEATALALVARLLADPAERTAAPASQDLRSLEPEARLARVAAFLGRGPGVLARIGRAARANLTALAAYRPRPLAVPVVLFRATDPLPPALLGVESGRVPTPSSPDHGWGAHAERLTVVPVPGDHFTLLEAPHRNPLVQRLELLLRESHSPMTE